MMERLLKASMGVLFLLFAFSLFMLAANENMKKTASEKECGIYHVIATREVHVWWPGHTGTTEVVCATAESGGARTTNVSIP